MSQSSPHNMTTIGVLLTNLGTPAAATKKAVHHFLAEFLSDQRVIELPRFIWQCLLKGIILPIRSRQASALYQKIWTKDGSPLLVITKQQTQALQQALTQDVGPTIKIACAMRYGQPSIAAGLAALRQQQIQRLLIFPLYPQYSATTVASTFDAIAQEFKQWRWLPELRMITHYAANPAYIQALTTSIKQHWQTHGKAAKLILSFHGLPQCYITRGDPYYTQCQQTAKLIAQALDLNQDDWILSFQSRVGKTQWLQPYTNEVLTSLAEQGIKSVDIICPGFAADCLETLEEIVITNQAIFHKAGGETYHYIPALNTRPAHIEMMKKLVIQHTQGWEN